MGSKLFCFTMVTLTLASCDALSSPPTIDTTAVSDFITVDPGSSISSEGKAMIGGDLYNVTFQVHATGTFVCNYQALDAQGVVVKLNGTTVVQDIMAGAKIRVVINAGPKAKVVRFTNCG